MKIRTQSLTICLTLIFTLLLTACPNRTSIADLKRDPRRYENKDVAIAGRVVDSYGLLGRGVYEVDDGTGRLWVLTERGIPERGARVGAKGNLIEGLNFSGRNYGLALREENRRER